LTGQQVVLGVTGSIAAYKSPDLVRRLREAGTAVQVAMTAGAQEFVRAATLQAVSGQTVRTDLWDATAEAAMGHIELARWADRVLIAPATANFMARLAHGFADDLLTALCLATEAPIVLAPAMNRVMWANAATQANVNLLASRGMRLLGPAEGELAEGEVGPGRMLEPVEIVQALAGEGSAGALANTTVLVSAGPTREAVDPVRFIGNNSSGKMGFAVAVAAARAGARVVLISGPVALATPQGVERINVETATDMHAAVMERIASADIFIGAAAVADYAPASPAHQKIKKTAGNLHIELVRTPDILAEVAALPERPFTVGFAAETEHLEANAQKKLKAKRLDMLAANWVGQGRGFDTDENALTVLWPSDQRALAKAPKERLAAELIALIAKRYRERKVVVSSK
jgi:phosphopantothenoylcysteine decarboxylase/phosphopantothenate--cysteine ligase